MPSTEADRLLAYQQARPADELFWQEQERVMQGGLGQPACTLSGISTGMMKMRGRFAVVIHGERECASCFRHGGPANVQFFFTGLQEREFVTGETHERLRRCLHLVARKVQPDVILVLGACPIEVIGDRFEVQVNEIAEAYPHITFRALHTSGLKVGTQTAMLDWMFETLASVPEQPLATEIARWDFGTPPVDAPRERSLNLLAVPMPLRHELAPIEPYGTLSTAGLHLIGSYPEASSLSAWRVIHHAAATFVADRSLYPKFVGTLEARGQQVVQVPLPIGLGPTLALYDVIGQSTGRAEEVAAAIAPLREHAETSIAAFRERFAGMKLAYGVRMVNNYQADLLAYGGLGDYHALMELGFDVTLLVQGPPDKRDKFKKMFERRGVDLPFEMFLEPWVLGDILRDGQFDLACVADHVRNEASKAGVPMIVSRALHPWLTGVPHTTVELSRILVNAGRG